MPPVKSSLNQSLSGRSVGLKRAAKLVERAVEIVAEREQNLHEVPGRLLFPILDRESVEENTHLSEGVVPRVTIRADGRVFRCEIHAWRNPDRARAGRCRMRPVKRRQIGNVGLSQRTS